MASQHLPRLPHGFREHYKHGIYRVNGVGVLGGEVGIDPARGTFLGVASYSEDASRRLLVKSLVGGVKLPEFVIFEIVVSARPPLELAGPMAVYKTMDQVAGESTSRLWVRPLEGPCGFNTPVVVRGRPVERFRDLGSMLSSVRVGHVADPDDLTYCRICGGLMSESI